VRRVKAEEISAGGIIIPQVAQEQPTQAEVLAVGRGRRLDDGTRRAAEVSPGDRVIFGKYQGTEVELNHESYVVLREADLLAVIES